MAARRSHICLKTSLEASKTPAEVRHFSRVISRDEARLPSVAKNGTLCSSRDSKILMSLRTHLASNGDGEIAFEELPESREYPDLQ